MDDAAPNGQEQATEATDAQMAAAAAARGAGNGTIDRNAPNGAQANLNDEPGLDGYERYVMVNFFDASSSAHNRLTHMSGIKSCVH